MSEKKTYGIIRPESHGKRERLPGIFFAAAAVFCLLTGTALSSVSTAGADTADKQFSLSVSSEKIIFSLSADPSVTSVPVRVSNTGKEALSVYFYFTKDGLKDHGVLSVFSLSEERRILGPGEEMNLTVTLIDAARARRLFGSEKENIKLNLFYVPVRNDSVFAGGIRLPVCFSNPAGSAPPGADPAPGSTPGGAVSSGRITNTIAPGQTDGSAAPTPDFIETRLPVDHENGKEGDDADDFISGTDSSAGGGVSGGGRKAGIIRKYIVLILSGVLSAVLISAVALYAVRKKGRQPP